MHRIRIYAYACEGPKRQFPLTLEVHAEESHRRQGERRRPRVRVRSRPARACTSSLAAVLTGMQIPCESAIRRVSLRVAFPSQVVYCNDLDSSNPAIYANITSRGTSCHDYLFHPLGRPHSFRECYWTNQALEGFKCKAGELRSCEAPLAPPVQPPAPPVQPLPPFTPPSSVTVSSPTPPPVPPQSDPGACDARDAHLSLSDAHASLQLQGLLPPQFWTVHCYMLDWPWLKDGVCGPHAPAG